MFYTETLTWKVDSQFSITIFILNNHFPMFVPLFSDSVTRIVEIFNHRTYLATLMFSTKINSNRIWNCKQKIETSKQRNFEYLFHFFCVPFFFKLSRVCQKYFCDLSDISIFNIQHLVQCPVANSYCKSDRRSISKIHQKQKS